MKWLLIAVVPLAALALTGPASAVVSFDPHTATGTVDRSDVQQAFGWTNAQMGRNKHDVTFVLFFNLFNQFRCGSGYASFGAEGLSEPISSEYRGDFVLQGLTGSSTVSGSLPSVGDPCPSGDGSTVVFDSGPADEAALEVEYAGKDVIVADY